MVDDYVDNRATGSFILIDPGANTTVGAGMVLAPSRSPNVTRPDRLTTADDRLSRGSTVWFTGLSGSGKSTVAMHAERLLLATGRPAYVLDGDDLRHGLNADLGFSLRDRTENLRRTAHVASILAASGQVVLVTTISPLSEHRALARQIHADVGVELIEVFVDSPLELCEARDPKGLYARARAGEITDLTGIGSPFEAPTDPDVRLVPTDAPEVQATQVIAELSGG
jgi:bifunctional enzyme CysN/CysC